MFQFSINKKQFIMACAIGLISAVGDKNMENEKNHVVVAVIDNVTHALIGAFTWFGAFINKTSKTDICFIIQVLLCGIFASVIDVDHFIAAKSLKLKDATSLKSRPFMHCTTLVLLIVFTVIIFSYLVRMNWLFKFGLILAAAFLSHHIRDSKRRGLWIWPLGHTPPVPFLVQIIAQMLFPYFLSAVVSKITLPETFNVESIRTIEPV